MPRVPQAAGPQVAVRPLPTVRSTVNHDPDAYGAGIGRGLVNVGGALSAYAEQEQQKQDTAALMGAERQLQQWQNQALFTPETGAFAQRGQNAFGLPEKIMPEWDKQVSDLEAGMTDKQRQVFRERAGNMRTSMERDLFRHVGQESETYHKQETASLVATRAETGLLYWNNPARFEKELREAQGVFMAGSPGAPPAAIQQGLNEIESRMRSGVIEKMVAEDPIAADEYFKTYNDKLTDADRQKAERVIKPARDDAMAEREIAVRINGQPGAAESAPKDYTTYRRRLESGGRADAKNPNSSAYGADQFTKGTWLETVRKAKPAWAEGLAEAQLLELRADPAKSGEMADVLDQDNTAALERAGLPVTNHTLYAAHHFGAGGGVKFARADMDTPMEEILTAAQLDANKYLKGKTKAEAMANWDRRAGASVDGNDTVTTKQGGIGSDAVAAPWAPPATKAEGLARLTEIADPVVRKLAIDKYERQIQIAKMAEQERATEYSEAINTAIETATPGASLRSILSPEQYAWAVEQGKLEAWQTRMNKRVEGLEPVTNPVVFEELQTMFTRAENGDNKALQAVKNLDPTTLYSDLDRQARDYVQTRRGAILGGGKSKNDKEMDFASEDDQLNATFEKLGISRNPTKGEDEATAKTRQTFREAYWAIVDAKQKETGKKVNAEDRQKILSDMLLPYAKKVRDDYLFGLIEHTSTETKRGFEISIVPVVDRRQIVAAYQSKFKRDPTDAEVRALYARSQGYQPQLEKE